MEPQVADSGALTYTQPVIKILIWGFDSFSWTVFIKLKQEVCVVACRDDGGLPDGVELVGSSLTLQGPVEHRQAGLYGCTFSYHRLKAAVQFNITVNPRVVQPGRWISLWICLTPINIAAEASVRALPLSRTTRRSSLVERRWTQGDGVLSSWCRSSSQRVLASTGGCVWRLLVQFHFS